MQVVVIVPVKELRNIKSRLSSILNLGLRQELSFLMLNDVLSAIKTSSLTSECIVVSPDDRVLSLADSMGVQPLKENKGMGVNAAVSKATKCAIKWGAMGAIVLPGDIPLISPLDIDEIIRAGRLRNSTVITPSVRLDGTNALLRNPPNVVPTCYDRDSFNSHIKEAQRRGIRIKLLLLRRIMLDIDTPEDIREFLSIRSNTSTYNFLSRIQ